jgi:hypothetical protein
MQIPYVDKATPRSSHAPLFQSCSPPKKLPKESAELLLAEINANSKWVSLASSADERIVLETLKYLTDRAYGKARQAIEASATQGTDVQFIVRSILDKP